MNVFYVYGNIFPTATYLSTWTQKSQASTKMHQASYGFCQKSHAFQKSTDGVSFWEGWHNFKQSWILCATFVNMYNNWSFSKKSAKFGRHFGFLVDKLVFL